MLTPISNSAIPRYAVEQKSPAPLLLSLPPEIQQEVINHMDAVSRLAFFKALTIVTRNSEPINSPILKLHLLLQRIPPKYQQTLTRLDPNLQAFALNQLQTLWKLDQLEQIVERPALFKLIFLTCNPEVFKFLGESIRPNANLRQKLINWIERSKTEDVQTAAANALTLLVRAGVQFNGLNLNGIRVPGADLSFGWFSGTQFRGADLRAVNFYHAHLSNANLQKANLTGVKFGELPSLDVSSSDVVHSCCYSPDGRWLAVGLSFDKVKLYRMQTLELEHTLRGFNNHVASVSFSPDSKYLGATGGHTLHHTVNLWRVESGEKLRTLVGHSRSIYSVSFSPNNELLASGSSDKTIKLWEVESGEVVRTFIGHNDDVRSVSFSPDGEFLVSGSKDKSIKLWEVKTGIALRTFEGHSDAVTSVKFSPNGEFLASGSMDKTVRLWKTESGEELHMLNGHHGGISNVDFSPNGDLLASGAWWDGVKLWEVVSGEEVRTFGQFGGSSNLISFSPKGELLAVGNNKSVKLWKVDNWKVCLYYLGLASKGLDATGMSIQGAQGLSSMDVRLLKQRGAGDEVDVQW